MPTYEYRCSGCGWIEEDVRRIDERDDPFEDKCPMKCEMTGWQRIQTLSAIPSCLKDKKRFPHVSHIREDVLDRLPDGRFVPGTRPVTFYSRSHMERYMEENGWVHYEEPPDGGTQAMFGQMPAHIKQLEDHPQVKKYLDLKSKGKIPESMILTQEQLTERFEFDA